MIPHRISIKDLPTLSARQAAISVAPRTDAEEAELTARIKEIAALIKARNLESGLARNDSPPPSAKRLAISQPATDPEREEACRQRARSA